MRCSFSAWGGHSAAVLYPCHPSTRHRASPPALTPLHHRAAPDRLPHPPRQRAMHEPAAHPPPPTPSHHRRQIHERPPHRRRSGTHRHHAADGNQCARPSRPAAATVQTGAAAAAARTAAATHGVCAHVPAAAPSPTAAAAAAGTAGVAAACGARPVSGGTPRRRAWPHSRSRRRCRRREADGGRPCGQRGVPLHGAGRSHGHVEPPTAVPPRRRQARQGHAGSRTRTRNDGHNRRRRAALPGVFGRAACA